MNQDCVTCKYAERDHRNRYLCCCAGYGNCSYEHFDGIVDLFPEEKMNNLLLRAEDYFSDEECQKAFVVGIEKCLGILEEENSPID